MASPTLNRRELLAGAGATAAALAFDTDIGQAQATQARPVVFTNTTVVTVDEVRNGVALAVQGGRIAAIGPNDEVMKQYQQAEIYDGRGKALFPGLINCHAHLAQTLAARVQRGLRFPNSYKLAVEPSSLISKKKPR